MLSEKRTGDGMSATQNTSSAREAIRKASPRSIISLVIYLFLPPALLFGGAGTIKWAMAWVYIVLTVGGAILSRILVARVHPDLLAERSASMDANDVPAWDRKLVPLISTIIPLLLMLTAGLDKRFGWTQPLPAWAPAGGTLIVVAAIALAILAMVTNRYFSAFVRLQGERGQQVVSSGPYAFVRHPGYTGGLLTNIGIPLMLGSLWTFLPSLLGIVLLVLRTELEDRFLVKELVGYRDYTKKVRYKLLPKIW